MARKISPGCGPIPTHMHAADLLIVDDDGTQRAIIGEILEAEGHSVRHASDGLQALEEVQHRLPDLILLDILMPCLDGISTLRKLRAEDSSASLPVIVTTGLDDARSIQAAFDAGATDFLVKPVQERVLVERVRFVLRADAMMRELREARRSAENEERLKTEFVGTVSHEMRTPLNGILGIARLLLQQNLSPAVNENIAMILQSAERLRTTVEAMLDYSELELGKLALQSEPVLPSLLVAQLREAFAAGAVKLGTELTFSLSDSLPRAFRGDPARIRQIVASLIDNSLRYSGATSVDVTLSPIDQQARSGLQIVVRDDGSGLAEPDQEALFTPFARTQRPMARSVAGLGLGLSMCSRLVHLMDGDLRLESSPGQGATVSIRLPLPTVEQPPADNPSPRPEGHAHGLPVLVVEDNPINARLLSRLLRKRGFDVRLASHGLEAIEHFRRESALELILMDLNMPVMDGFEATRRIRQISRTSGRSPWIAAVSAHADSRSRRLAFEAGVDEFLAKPFDTKSLISILERATNKRSRNAPVS